MALATLDRAAAISCGYIAPTTDSLFGYTGELPSVLACWLPQDPRPQWLVDYQQLGEIPDGCRVVTTEEPTSDGWAVSCVELVMEA